jgi:hypothetical protein
MNTTLIHQLRALAQFTRTEGQIARVRVAQARTDAVQRELRENAANSDSRYARIEAALRDLGAVPDVVTPALGRILAMIKGVAEQAQPIDEALLGDLTLEHQLLDRARYVKVLARRANRPDIEKLADDLVEAHTATVDWLTTVLAEEALGGPAALQPTPLQQFAAGVGKALTGPARFAVEQANRAAHTVARRGAQARDAAFETTGALRDQAARAGERVAKGAEEAAATAQRFGRDAAEVAATGRDAALQRAEQVAEREGASGTATAVHETRRDLGVLKASELPIKHFEEMSPQTAIAAIRELDDPEDIQAVIAFEEAHRNRSGVVSAAQTRYAAVAKDAAGVHGS